jgi:DNA mismatch endonuclease (patch repair protein)
MDVVSPAVRSRMMGGIKGRNTKPERIVRSVAHRLGLRFRLHRADLPGRPDIVFSRHRAVILVHGCFWHRHDCGLAASPKTRPEFWQAKFQANVRRDALTRLQLEEAGWRVIVIWECETRDAGELAWRLLNEFGLPAK